MIGIERRIGRVQRQHPHRQAPPTAPQDGAHLGAGGNVDGVGVDAVAGVAERLQRSTARRGAWAAAPALPRPSHSARADPHAHGAQRAAHVEAAIAPVAARRAGAERRGAAHERIGDLGGVPVAVRRPHHRGGGGHERRRERRAGRGEDRLGALRDGARGDHLDSSPRGHEVNLALPRRPDRWRPWASRSRATARRLRGRPAARRGTRRARRSRPPLPTAATTSAPDSWSARSDSTSAREGVAVAETFTIWAPCRRSQPNDAMRPCSSTASAARSLAHDPRREQRGVGDDADHAADTALPVRDQHALATAPCLERSPGAARATRCEGNNPRTRRARGGRRPRPSRRCR